MSVAMLQEVLGNRKEPFTCEQVFDCLSEVVFFIKNTRCEYVVVNSTFVERCRAAEKRELLGKTAAEVFPAPHGQRYEEQDRRVLETGRSLLSELELHFFSSGSIGWCLTSKLPLKDVQGKVTGLVGVSHDLKLPDKSTREFEQVSAALRYAEEHVHDSPSVTRLAEVAGITPYKLDRCMRSIFGLSMGQWLLKARIDLSRQLLAECDLPIAEVAARSGYSDQSAFTRQFRKTTGVSPSTYRADCHGGLPH